MQLIRNRKIQLKDILNFTINFPLINSYPPDLIQRFLTDFISSNEMIFDIFHENERVCVAVLLDKTNNRANSANLEILGINNKYEAQIMLRHLLELAKESLPLYRDAIDLSYNEAFKLDEKFFVSCGYVAAYSMHEMSFALPYQVELKLPANFSFKRISHVEVDNYYEVLVDVFKESEDTNIPPVTELKNRFLQTGKYPTVLWHKNKMTGLVTVEVMGENEKVGVINTIGLIRDYRGKGLSYYLIQQAFLELLEKNIHQCKLFVSSKNKSALGLYSKIGFKSIKADPVFRWVR